MTSPEDTNVAEQDSQKLLNNRSLATSPTSTTSDCHSGDESYIEEKNVIPATLIEDELKLALNKVRKPSRFFYTCR